VCGPVSMNAQVVFASGSKGRMAGVEASVSYGVEADGAATAEEEESLRAEYLAVSFDLHWENPYISKLHCAAVTQPPDYAGDYDLALELT
jgi:coproporphyrinogen III oxidase